CSPGADATASRRAPFFRAQVPLERVAYLLQRLSHAQARRLQRPTLVVVENPSHCRTVVQHHLPGLIDSRLLRRLTGGAWPLADACRLGRRHPGGSSGAGGGPGSGSGAAGRGVDRRGRAGGGRLGGSAACGGLLLGLGLASLLEDLLLDV